MVAPAVIPICVPTAARGSALLRNFAQKRTAWSRPRERRDVPGRVYAAEKRSGSFAERGAEHFPRVHEGRGLGPRRYQVREQVVVLGIEQDHPEMLPVIVLVAQQIPGELDHGLGRVELPRGWRPDLTHDGPGCDLQTVTLRSHFWAPLMDGGVSGRGRTRPPLACCLGTPRDRRQRSRRQPQIYRP